MKNPLGLTWRQISDAIRTMPEWAQDELAMIWVSDDAKVQNDENYSIDEIITSYSKEPGEDEHDYAFMVFGDIVY